MDFFPDPQKRPLIKRNLLKEIIYSLLVGIIFFYLTYVDLNETVLIIPLVVLALILSILIAILLYKLSPRMRKTSRRFNVIISLFASISYLSIPNAIIRYFIAWFALWLLIIKFVIEPRLKKNRGIKYKDLTNS